MSNSMWCQTASRRAIIALTAAICACSPVGERGMGPSEPAGPAPVTDVHHQVRVRMDSITVMGSCDHNSIFESSGDGEFDFRVAVLTTDVIWGRSVSGTYKEGVHALSPASTWTASFQRLVSTERKVPELQDFSIEFRATEKDGVLGNDPDMTRHDRILVQWNGTGWAAPSVIQLRANAQCGVRLRFTITSTPA